ncbi:MAG: divergent polysaccharide deacetylase family protein [Treponema sp.]|nr:divergent polysaccharide deacetylase family protein [Treponema sp.]
MLPDFPPASNNAKLIFVFDDAGMNLSQLEKFVTLPFPITVAVLPKLNYSRASADRVRSSGNE